MENIYGIKHDQLVKAIEPLVFETHEGRGGYELELPEIYTTLKTEVTDRGWAINVLAEQLEELTVSQLISRMPSHTTFNDLVVQCVLLNNTLFGHANLKGWKPLNLDIYL